MARRKRSMVSNPESSRELPAFTFRLTFRFYDLECWRELCVPKSFTFEDFHTAIQACMSWLNYHLYNFEFKSKGEKWQVSWPDFETGGNPFEDFGYWFGGETYPKWADAAMVRLDEVFPRTRTALYSYDYGDGWEIDVKLVDSKTPLVGESPLCVAGEGDNPPEDVGGECGFIQFLRTIESPNDPEFDHMAAWGERQTFEHFSISSTNARLACYNNWRVKGVYDEPRNAESGQAVPKGSASSSSTHHEGAYAEAEHLTNYRTGTLAGLSEEERRAVLNAFIDREPDPGLSDFMLADPVETLKSLSRSGSPKFTLQELLTLLKKDALVEYANIMDLKGPHAMKKADLVYAVAAELRNPIVLKSFAEPIPLAHIDKVRNLIAAGGRLHVQESEIESIGDIIPPCEPLVFVFHTRRGFDYVVPDDLLEAARTIDWEDVRRLAGLRVELRKLAEASVELRGIVPVYEFLDECKATGIGVTSDSEAIRLTMEASATMPLFAFLVTEDDSFLLDFELASAYLDNPETAATVDPEAPFIQGPLGKGLEAILFLQEDTEPRPVPPDMLEHPLAALWREELPAARNLRNWLDGHVPDGADEYRFADTMISDFCNEVRWWNGDSSSLAAYLDNLADEGLVLEGEEAETLVDLLTAFRNEQPIWAHNGWSSDEIAKR